MDKKTRKKPNIVFILSDQHNADVLGSAGDIFISTPNIDKLANNGVTLSNCYCASPLCVPSRSSLLSSRLPSETQVFNNFQCLRSDEATFVHSLSANGYETVLSGRMHFIGPDQRHGFEKRFVGDITKSYPGRGDREKVYGKLVGTPAQHPIAIEKSGAGYSAGIEYDYQVLEKTKSYLQERSDERPLFLTVGFHGPHCPYICSKELFDKYYALLPNLESTSSSLRENMHPAIKEWFKNRNIDHVSSKDIQRVRAAYYGMIEHLDGQIGELIAQIENTIGLENTIIVYASDHGDNIGKHGLFWKTNFYEGASRVPAIFSSPGLISSDTKITELTSLLDFGPTFISFAESDPLPENQGFDLAPIMIGEEDPDSDRFVISQLADIKGDRPSAMIRKEKWKLISYHGYDRVQLFNLEDDPDENVDLGEVHLYSSIREELLKLLANYWNSENVFQQLSHSIEHYNLLNKFTQVNNLKGFEEWYPVHDVEKINFLY